MCCPARIAGVIALNILLVQPEFPTPSKSKNHGSRFPVGLLKIGAYHIAQGDKVALRVGMRKPRLVPDEIKITSLFTYWADQVHETARYYHSLYPNAKVEVGGIYATLMPDDCRKALPFAEVCPGLYRGGVAEDYVPAFSLLSHKTDTQVVHASRGCKRKCRYCAVWKIEPNDTYLESMKKRIRRRKLLFYDNNLLMNPHIESILEELAKYRDGKGRHVWCECQSGLDRRILNRYPNLAGLLRKARFHNPRIAWDGRYGDLSKVRRAVRILRKAGYPASELYVFMLYNHEIPYAEMKAKLEACRRWGVRVADCRFRPLDRTTDGYNPRLKAQAPTDYYIHPKWSDREVRRFRRTVRRQNIGVMLGLPNNRYVAGCERGYVGGKATSRR